MRKVKKTLWLAVLAVMILLRVNRPAFALYYGDYLEYSVSDGTCTITGFRNKPTELTIPGTIDGKPVTALGNGAFKYCTELTSLSIPESVTAIGRYAFLGCEKLKTVNIPSGVTKIEDETFYCCYSLESIAIPAGVTAIGEYAFYNCTSLLRIEVPSGVTSIGQDAFAYCSSAESINIPAGVTVINSQTFMSCYKLKDIAIPAGVTDIGDSAFAYCYVAQELKLPKGLTSIGAYAFAGWRGITYVEIPSGVTVLPDCIFDNCTNLTGVSIPDGVTSIGKRAFIYCTALSSVTLPKNLKFIGDEAFSCCDLRSVDIPAGVTSIGEQAFYCNYGIETVRLPASLTSLGEYAFGYGQKFKSIVIPQGVTAIEANTFSYCLALESIDIRGDLTSIGDYAFEGCQSLQSIKLPASLTEVGTEVFRKGAPVLGIYFASESAALDDSLMQGSDEEHEIIVLHPSDRLEAPAATIKGDPESGIPIVSWNAVEGAEKYLVYRKAGSNSWALQTTKGITETTYQSAKATVGVTYKYRVVAVSPYIKDLNSDYSNTVTLPCVLGRPAISLSRNNTGDPLISWELQEGAQTYQIFRKTGTGAWENLAIGITGTSYTDYNLTVGKKYSYRIAARAAAGSDYDSAYSNTVSVTYAGPTLPAPVLSVSMDGTTGRPVISWSPVAGASQYLVYRKAGSNSWSLQTSGGTTATTYQSSKATVGVTYKYRVIAVSPEGSKYNSDYSNTVELACILPAPKLSVERDEATGHLVVSWKAVAGAEKYHLYRKTNDGDWINWDENVMRTYFTDTDVTAGNEYSYKLIAEAEAGKAFDSLDSEPVSLFYTKPALPAPVLSIAMDEATGRPIVSWDPVEGAVKYLVYRKAGSNSWALQTSSGTTKTSYQSSKATVGTTYKYRVIAVSPDGKAYNSVYSASVSMACIAGRPTVSIERDKITGCPVVSWKAVTGADAYRVYRKAGDGEWETVGADTAALSFADGGLTVGTTYFYKVIAVSAKGNAYGSFESKTVNEVCTLPAPVITLSADGATGKPVISWDAVPGASKYYVYRKAGSNSWALQTTGGTTATSWLNSKVNDGKTYQYRVVAVCPDGSAYNSGYSNVVSLKYTAK